MPPICGTGIGTGIEMGWDGITITGPTSASPQWSRAWDCGAAFRLVYAKMAYCITSLCGLRSCSCHNFAQSRPRSQHQSQQCIPSASLLFQAQSQSPVSSPAASLELGLGSSGSRLQATCLEPGFVNRNRHRSEYWHQNVAVAVCAMFGAA